MLIADKMEVVRFFSVRQIEEFFAHRLECMDRREAVRWLEGYCADHKVKCGGYVYTAEDLAKIFDLNC